MTRKEKRKEKVRRRKNFLPTLIVTVFLWGITAFFVYFIDPYAFGAVPVLLLAVFLALLFTFSTLFANTRRGLLVAFALTLFLVLRLLGVGNIVNFLLIVGLATTAELYFSKNH